LYFALSWLTSVGLSMPTAFTVTNSPVTQAGVLTVAGAGTAAQYIDGTGALQTFTTYGKWVLAGDTGVQDVTTGQTASILGGTDIATVVTSPRILTINHSAVTRSNTTATASPNPGDTVDLVSIVSSSTTGHVTGVETTTVTWPANQNTTYTIDVPTATTSINLKGSDSTDDAIALVGGTNVTITRDNDSSLTFASLNTEYTAGTGLTLNTLEFDVNVNSTAGNAPESLTTTANRTYAIQLDNNSANLVVNVPWVDTDTIQTITGTGSDNTDSGILLSDSGGTVLILGAGSVTASQTGNTITLTGIDTDTGITGVTLATADSTGTPLSENITNRELTLTSHKYVGGANVGYVPEGGTAPTYLKGDGTWAAIPTGLQFKGTWDASGGGGGNPDLTLAANKGAGFLWICDVAGTAYPNGGTNPPSTWNLGDWAVYDGTAWTKVPATNSGVTSLTTTDGTFIDLTPNAATTGAVTVTADLSAQDGTSDTSTRFLSKDNTWDVPSYSDPGVTTFTNENGTFISAGTVNTNATGAVTTGIIDLSATGTKDSTTFLRGDNTWNVPPGTYTLPVATSTILGGIELGSDTVLTTAYVAGNAGSATRSYPVQLNANRQAAVYVPWENTQNPNQTITGAGSNNTDSGITLNESGGTVLILGATGIAASQAANTVTLTGTTYDINFQPNTGASPQINPFLRLTETGTATGTTDLEIVGTGATTVTRNSDNKITINSTAGSYSWDVRDNSNVDKEVLNGEYLKFVTATGALNTALTGTGTNTDPYVMTLTSPNDNDNTTYDFLAVQTGNPATNDNPALRLDPSTGNNDDVTLTGGSNMTITRDSNTEITFTAANDNTLYDLAGAASATAGEYNLVLSADSTAQDTMVFKQGSNVTFTRAANLLTIESKWDANSKLVAGYVAAPGAVASKVWKTDANGNPDWRDDATGDNTTYTIGSGNTKVITLTGSDSSTSTVTFADGSDISIAGNNGTITITNESPDTGLPAIIVDDAAGNMSFGNTNVTASTVRTKIGAGTGDGIVTSLTTTGTSGASTLTNGVLNVPNYANDNTTYSISIPASTTKLRLTGVNPASTDDVEFVGGGITTVSRTDANKFTITSTEADTLATVTARGDTTTTKSYFNGDLEVKNEITVSKTDVNTPGKITINGNTDATLQLKSEDTALAANETLGVIEFYGSDGTSPGAGVKSSIRARNGDQTGGTGNKSNLIFAVSPGNAANNTEKMRINPTGSIAFNGATNYGTSGQLLQSNGDASPTWVTFNGVTGSGTQYKIPVWTSGTAIGDGNITNTSTGEIGINNSNPEDYNITSTKTGMLVVGDNSGSQQQNGIAICADAAGVGWLTFRKATGSASSDLTGGLSYSFDSDILGFRTDGEQQMFLYDDGRLSVGVVSTTGTSRLLLREALNDPEGGHIKLMNSRTGGDNWHIGVGDDGSTSTTTTPGSLYFNRNGTSTALVMTSSSNIGIGTTSPSGKFHVKVGTSTPFIVASSNYCNNVGIRTTTPTTSLQVKGNISYSYANYTNVANTWMNVISMAGYPTGLYQISIIKKTNASTYVTAIIKWDNSGSGSGTIANTITSNQLSVSFNNTTTLQAISGISTGTLMSANLQLLVTNEDSCS